MFLADIRAISKVYNFLQQIKQLHLDTEDEYTKRGKAKASKNKQTEKLRWGRGLDECNVVCLQDDINKKPEWSSGRLFGLFI